MSSPINARSAAPVQNAQELIDYAVGHETVPTKVGFIAKFQEMQLGPEAKLSTRLAHLVARCLGSVSSLFARVLGQQSAQQEEMRKSEAMRTGLCEMAQAVIEHERVVQLFPQRVPEAVSSSLKASVAKVFPLFESRIRAKADPSPTHVTVNKAQIRDLLIQAMIPRCQKTLERYTRDPQVPVLTLRQLEILHMAVNAFVGIEEPVQEMPKSSPSVTKRVVTVAAACVTVAGLALGAYLLLGTASAPAPRTYPVCLANESAAFNLDGSCPRWALVRV